MGTHHVTVYCVDNNIMMVAHRSICIALVDAGSWCGSCHCQDCLLVEMG